MKESQNFLTTPHLVIIVILLILSVSYYVNSLIVGKSPTHINTTESDVALQARLAEAKSNVQSETIKLNKLIVRSRSEQSWYSTIENGYSKANDAVNKIDSKLKLKITDANIQNDINTKLKEIANLLKSWNKTLADYKTETLTLLDLITITRNDISIIQAYIRELQNIVAGLTPANSGLTQSQINIYQQQINNAIIEIQNALVVPQDIQIQQNVVQQAQTEQARIEAEIIQSSQFSPISNPNQTPVQNNNWQNPTPNDEINDSQGPKLIEGANSR